MKDFYYILGLSPNCSLDEIKAAYRKLSKKLHPDLNQGDQYFENKCRDVKEAFETLRDPSKRRLYDDHLKNFKSQKPAEEPVKQRSSTRSYNHSTSRTYTRPAATKPGKIRKRGPGIGLSITLIILAIIIGVYFFRWFSASKPKTPLAYRETEVTPQPVHKKHRHKRTGKNLVAAKADKKSFDTAKIVVVKPDVIKPIPLKPGPIVAPVAVKPEPLRPMIAKTWPDSDRTHSDYLYTTYVHPNLTGIVQMREYDRFNSGIVASIPANARVFVLERGSIYYRVFYDNNIGFVPKWTLHQK
jgi:hypothetical protein